MRPQVSKAPFVLRLMPSFADFAFLLPAAYLFGRLEGFTRLLQDCDTGWHIRTGEWILANRQVPHTDLFSFSMPGRPWYAWEWASDILLAILNGMGGLRAVVLFSILLLCFTFLLIYRFARARSSALTAFAITLPVVVASSVHWLARPHLFTLLFVVLFLEALQRV